MPEAMSLILAVVGLPVLGLTVIFLSLILKSWWVKSKELRLKEEQIRSDMKLRQDQSNQDLIESHTISISARETEALRKEVQLLREEVSRLKADMFAKSGVSEPLQSDIPERDMQSE